MIIQVLMVLFSRVHAQPVRSVPADTIRPGKGRLMTEVLKPGLRQYLVYCVDPKKDNKLGEDASALVLESLEEHHIVKWTLSELEKMKATDERFEAKVTVLMESVQHHVKEEEEDLFPKVKRLLSAKILNDLGERMEKAKKLAPTRPHPRSSDTPPGNFVAGTVAAMMDKGRDLVKAAFSQ